MTSPERQAHLNGLRSLEGGGHSGVRDDSGMHPKAQPEHLAVRCSALRACEAAVPECGVSAP